MKKNKVTTSKKVNIKLNILLVLCTLFVSVGFSAMSTSLSVNGRAKFDPVGMIRVMSIEKDSISSALDLGSGYTKDTVNALISFNNASDIAKYNVSISNLGQTDKVLLQIIKEIYTNDKIEHNIVGLSEDDVIKAGETVNFSIVFKVKDGVELLPEEKLNMKFKFIFDDFVDLDPFPIVFKQEGACTFNGSTKKITGDECKKYWDYNLIDTKIDLYSEENYKKDFEIGFTIDEYDGSIQEVAQTVFINTKKETGSGQIVPGFAFRRNAITTKEYELTSYINNVSKKLFNTSQVKKIKIVRKDNVLYYSINDESLTLLQDMSGFKTPFNAHATFGGAVDINGNLMRLLKATLSNMYIKLGKYQEEKYIVTFDPNGGQVDEETRKINSHDVIGALPVPNSIDGKKFVGWYTDLTYKTKIDENYIVTSNQILYAKWAYLPVQINNLYYNTVKEALESNSSISELTIKLSSDISESITIDSGKNILLDLQNHTISNIDKYSTIINKGNLKIINGTISTNSNDNAAINNENNGILTIVDSNILATGSKQCLYNNGGEVIIKGSSYFSSTSSIRSAIHNLENSTLTILSGTVKAPNQSGLNNSGVLIIGEKDQNIDDKNIIIEGKNYGITTTTNISFYDGMLKGQTGAINNESKISDIEENSIITKGEEILNGSLYKNLYLILK